VDVGLPVDGAIRGEPGKAAVIRPGVPLHVPVDGAQVTLDAVQRPVGHPPAVEGGIARHLLEPDDRPIGEGQFRSLNELLVLRAPIRDPPGLVLPHARIV